MIARPEGRKLDMQVTGQPRVNMNIKGSPTSLTVNGKSHPVKKDGSMVNVKFRK